MESPTLETNPQPARPDNAFREFTPLRGLREGNFEEDAPIQPHVLCSKCKLLAKQLENPEKLEERFELGHHKIPFLMYEQHYETVTLLRHSCKRGCHLCSLLWDSFVDLRPECDEARPDSAEEWDKVKEAKFVLSIEKFGDFLIKPVIDAKPYLTEPRVGIELCIGKYNKANRPLPLTVSIPTISTKSATCRSFYTRCMEICDKMHTICHVKSVEHAPTRLLYVTPGTVPRIQLVSPGDKGLQFPKNIKFAALSYCWGTYPGLQLTLANYQNLTAVVPFDQLSPTIQDSVLVTVELGLRYLWVDALCIIQDCSDDWYCEAPKMYDVYQGCSITLTASGASDGGGGLFAARDPLREIPVLMGDLEARPSKRSLGPPWALDTRAWAKQEQMLSARNIKFGSFITWQCNELTITEFGPPDVTYLEKQKAQTFYHSILQPKKTDPFDTMEVRTLWSRVLSDYMKTQLTKRSDRLAAIMGLASAFQRRTGWGFVCGHWEPFMVQDLLWLRQEPRVQSTGLRPSWSWASRDGGVRVHSPRGPGRREDVAEYLGASSAVRGQTPLSSASVLHLSGVLLRAYKSERPSLILDRQVRVEDCPNAITLETRYDQKDRPWTDDQMILPLSCQRGTRGTITSVEGLMIVPTGDSGMFERVGYFKSWTHAQQTSRNFMDFLKRNDGEPLVRQKILLT